jgi:hypothetical protein
VNTPNHITSQPGCGLAKKSELWIMSENASEPSQQESSAATAAGCAPEFGCVDWFQYAQPPLHDAAVGRRLRRQQLCY